MIFTVRSVRNLSGAIDEKRSNIHSTMLRSIDSCTLCIYIEH